MVGGSLTQLSYPTIAVMKVASSRCRLALLCLVLFIAYIPLLIVANASANYVDTYRPALDSEGSHGLIRAIFHGELQRQSCHQSRVGKW